MDTSGILKDLVIECRENGKSIVKLATQIANMADLQKQQIDLILTKLNARQDNTDDRVSEWSASVKLLHEKHEESYKALNLRVSMLEKKPAEKALASWQFIIKVAVAVGLTTILCMGIGTFLAVTFGWVR